MYNISPYQRNFFKAILGLYEIFRIFGSYLWKRISNYLGISMCVNLSLVLLAIINVSQSFCFSINNIIIFRSLAGLFNNLSTFTKSFILALFSHKQHKKIMNFISIYQNFSPVIALLSGLVYEFLNLGEFFKNQDKNSIFSNLNKYSPITFFISVLCISTLILGMVKFKFKMVIPKRRTQFHEQILVHYQLVL